MKLFSDRRIPTVYCDPASKNARAILSDMDVRFIEQPEEADLIWMRKSYRKIYKHLSPYQLLNHIPGERSMINKGHLAWHLKQYARAHSKSECSPQVFFPETYCLYRTDDRKAFFEQLARTSPQENLWILKPAALSRGKGIRILQTFDELHKKYEEIPERHHRKKRGRHIIQKYIQDPLLLQGRKSEIRIYWLIASLDPLLVCMYKEGTVRLNTKPFSLDQFHDPLVHITNTYQQKHHPEYESLTLKWSFDKLETYLNQNIKPAVPKRIEHCIRPQIKNALSGVVRATRKLLTRTPDQGLFFGLYGADFIVDSKLHVWLTEIQKGPGLSHNDEVKKQVVPPMLQEAIQIVLEAQQQKQKRCSLPRLNNLEGFEWILEPDEHLGAQVE